MRRRAGVVDEGGFGERTAAVVGQRAQQNAEALAAGRKAAEERLALAPLLRHQRQVASPELKAFVQELFPFVAQKRGFVHLTRPPLRRHPGKNPHRGADERGACRGEWRRSERPAKASRSTPSPPTARGRPQPPRRDARFPRRQISAQFAQGTLLRSPPARRATPADMPVEAGSAPPVRRAASAPRGRGAVREGRQELLRAPAAARRRRRPTPGGTRPSRPRGGIPPGSPSTLFCPKAAHSRMPVAGS